MQIFQYLIPRLGLPLKTPTNPREVYFNFEYTQKTITKTSSGTTLLRNRPGHWKGRLEECGSLQPRIDSFEFFNNKFQHTAIGFSNGFDGIAYFHVHGMAKNLTAEQHEKMFQTLEMQSNTFVRPCDCRTEIYSAKSRADITFVRNISTFGV